MHACSNLHVSGGFSIFGNTFNTAFGVSHRFVTPIKGYRVMNSFVPLAGFEFLTYVYGLTPLDAASTGLFRLLLS